ncbi:hypothetical protein B2A_06773, partial [mine drainage metagenome]
GRTTNLVRVPTVFPLQRPGGPQAAGPAKKTLLVELNYTGQFGRLLRAETGVDLSTRLLKYDGEPFFPFEIVAKAVEVMNHGG